MLLVEALLREDGSGPLTVQLYSLNMLVQTEGRERTAAQYAALLAAAGFTDIQHHLTGKIYDAVLAHKEMWGPIRRLFVYQNGKISPLTHTYIFTVFFYYKYKYKNKYSNIPLRSILFRLYISEIIKHSNHLLSFKFKAPIPREAEQHGALMTIEHLLFSLFCQCLPETIKKKLKLVNA